MNAHIIVDPYRQYPNETLEKELDAQGIDAKIWLAVHLPHIEAYRSINMSHKQIVAFAKAHHLPEICIMEEDVMFTAPDAWRYFLANKPESFDLYLGGCYGLNQVAYSQIAEQPGATEIHNFAGLHCYIIDESYYDRFLELPEDIHIDNQPGLGRFFVCSPFAALQHPGWSSNNKAKVNYNKKIPYQCIYHGKG